MSYFSKLALLAQSGQLVFVQLPAVPFEASPQERGQRGERQERRRAHDQAPCGRTSFPELLSGEGRAVEPV